MMASSIAAVASEFTSISDGIDAIINQKRCFLLIICWDRQEFLSNFSADGPASWAVHPPTISQIASSKNIRIAFTPTLMHLRAYMASLPQRKDSLKATEGIKILDLLRVHRSTSEFSAQGISRTLALVLETSMQLRLHLQLIEVLQLDKSMDIDDHNVFTFRENVPILNGSSHGEDHVWAGRTVEIGSIFAKWCKVEGRFRRIP